MIQLHLSERERELISDHTYPFPELEEQLTKLAGTPGAATVEIGSFYLDRLLADVVYAAKKLSDDALLGELDALYTELEVQARRQGYQGAP